MNLVVTNHAVKRYQERYKSHLGSEQARKELEALTVLVTEPLAGRPEWLGDGRAADQWIELAPDVVGAVTNSTVITIFARSGISKEHRERKRAEKKKRQADRKHQRKTLYRSGRPERKAISWE